jgi:cephalosporin hydroxylase
MQSEIISYDEFLYNRRIAAAEMRLDSALLSRALEVKVEAGHKHMWVHQTNWLGEPCLQLPTDMLAIAAAVYKSQPQHIIECGVAWGGTTLFLSSLLKLISGAAVIGIDVYIPTDLRDRIRTKSQSLCHIELLEMSTIDSSTVNQVRTLIGASNRVLVLLDSMHTHNHVLAELNAYSRFVGPGQYLICGDTAIDIQPPAPLRPRPWGPGNNPATALREFLSSENGSKFILDSEIENSLLMSNNWGGYLRNVG